MYENPGGARPRVADAMDKNGKFACGVLVQRTYEEMLPSLRG